MEVAKLQVPTTRKRKRVAEENGSELKDTVEERNGEVIVECTSVQQKFYLHRGQMEYHKQQ